LQQLVEQKVDKYIVIVSHGDVMDVLYCAATWLGWHLAY
jgi:broad specificity phosphatase PhoE